MFEARNWSTSDAPKGRKEEHWKDAVCEAVFELELSLPQQSSFEASIHQQPLGPIGMSAINISGAQSIKRTPKAIARSMMEQFEFVTLLEGQAHLEHDGQEVSLSAGDSVLIDSRKPYSLSTEEKLRNLSFHIPVDWLRLWMPNPGEMVARPIRKNMPWGKTILAMTRTIPDQSSEMNENGASNFRLYADQLAGAITLAFSQYDTKSHGSTMHICERAKIKLAEHAQDGDLNAQKLANILNVSVRYMHKAFANEGTTYSNELLNVRLGLAARMLKNSRFNNLSIAEIAWRSGFSDPSHFSRRFRENFSQPPGFYRNN